MASKEGLKTILGLYRQILRAHYKQLPTPMRSLGDGYAREEFRRHLEAKTTQEQWIEFGSQWSKYLSTIAPATDTAPGSPGPRGGSGVVSAADLSGDLSPEILAALNDEQRVMLDKLRDEALSYGASLRGAAPADANGVDDGGR